MSEAIPEKAQEAIRAELDGDTEKYRNDVPDGEWSSPNRGPSQLLTMRVPREILEELQTLAAENGMSVSTLARSFIADGLARQRGDDLRTMVERLERDLAALKARALAS